MGRILIVLLALITMGTAANATTLATGPIFGGSSQNNAFCILYNAGTAPVTVSGIRISSEFVADVPLIFSGCRILPGHLLGPGAFCSIQANISNIPAHTCRVDISPNGATVRGEVTVRHVFSPTSLQVLQNEQLR